MWENYERLVEGVIFVIRYFVFIVSYYGFKIS